MPDWKVSKKQVRDAWEKWTSGKGSMPKLAEKMGCNACDLYYYFTRLYGEEEVKKYGHLAHTTLYNPMKKRTIFHRYDRDKTEKLFETWKKSSLSLRAFSKNKDLCPIGEG